MPTATPSLNIFDAVVSSIRVGNNSVRARSGFDISNTLAYKDCTNLSHGFHIKATNTSVAVIISRQLVDL